MSNFSKFSSWFLAAAVVLATFGQIQNSSGEAPFFQHPQESNIPAYSGITSHILWDLIDFNSSSSLFNLYSNTNSEEDSNDHLEAEAARESSLEAISALYLSTARDIDISPTIGELLYPFYFYF
ncbi:MAG: hypothetical protein U5K72_12975 [Balneolaceae bacterium]|nr:hypothetical protein [Balneolaceae bacterium]